MLDELSYEYLYHSIFNKVPEAGNYIKYKSCTVDFERNYFRRVKKYLRTHKPTEIIVIFLESCPQAVENYMFRDTMNMIRPNTDSFLWNIYRGFYPTSDKRTKSQVLYALLEYTTLGGVGKKTPVVILDLFPWHGIDLNAKSASLTFRRHYIDSFNENKELLLLDVNISLEDLDSITTCLNKYFLFAIPNSVWSYLGGAGGGSLYIDDLKGVTGPLGKYCNKSNVINVGGQNISQRGIQYWRMKEQL